jgi:hypothetical protein
VRLEIGQGKKSKEEVRGFKKGERVKETEE